MTHESESQGKTNETGWQAEWAAWWQGYWSDTPADRATTPEPRPAGYAWRESKHEFDFGGER